MGSLNTEAMPLNYSCPPLTDADYLTSSRLASRRPSRQASKSPITSIGPSFGDHVDEDKLSVDPRRFTPTLHANLVSEILSLRREVENKNLLVENLEEHMAQMKEENTKLHEISSGHSKEKRSLRKQLDALESGTLVAIEAIAQERDRAQQLVTDLRSKFEQSQKKVRNQEEDNERTQKFWQQDQEKWDTERRTFERRIHVVEGRLKVVLAEVAAQQTASAQTTRKSLEQHANRSWSRERPGSRASGRRSAASHYRDSSNHTSTAGSKTLADELNLDSSSDHTESETELDSPEALPEEHDYARSYSSQSNRQSVKARKLLGLHIDASEELGNVRDSLSPNAFASFTNTYADVGSPSSAKFSPSYIDAATQYSPPTPPVTNISIEQRLSTITEFDGDSMFDDPTRSRPISANLSQVSRNVNMVSSACQTISAPLSPPETPIHSRPESEELLKRKPVSTSSTQTVANLFTATMGTNSSIPVITIHPSKSSTDVVLPPNSHNASAQANITSDTRSIAVQTEAIRTDERLTKIPEHLHPKIILPESPAPSPASTPGPESQEEAELETFTSNLRLRIPNKKGGVGKSILRNVLERRIEDDDTDGNISDDSFLKKVPIKKVLSKVQDSWQLVASPTDMTAELTDTEESKNLNGGFEKGKKPNGKNQPRSTNLKPDHALDDLIKEPSKANIGRARSPSEPSRGSVQSIPFPVPDRSSSRKFPWLNDDMFDSPTPKAGRNSRGSRSAMKRPAIRKSRSEIGKNGRLRSPSPQQFDVFTDSLANIPPPLPENEITSPTASSFRQHSVTTHHTRSLQTQSDSAGSDQTSMVDSIAQTMIGEWMFKYVRRRKSFGIPDEPGTGESSVNGGIRHQRWVWVAPYERAVMWSSKQPTSGTALMGKNGRKLVISSVLDVRDDSAMPKGAPSTSHHGHSILILTPQRALKFTAVSLDRHYVWMNALSFLSQGSVDLTDVMPNPTTQAPGSSVTGSSNMNSARNSVRGGPRSHRSNQSSISGSLHRSRVNDSIRIAKGKDRPLPGQRAYTNPSYATQQEIQEDEDDNGAEAPCVPRNSGEKKRTITSGNRGRLNSIRSHTSTKPSLYSLKSRGGDTADGGRNSLRLWSAKTQRNVNENGSAAEIPRAASRLSTQPDGSNLFEAVGTMRMSAFMPDTSSRQFGKQKATNVPRLSLNNRTASTNDLDYHTDAAQKSKYSRRSLVRTNGLKESAEQIDSAPPQLPPLTSGGRDPFEGF